MNKTAKKVVATILTTVMTVGAATVVSADDLSITLSHQPYGYKTEIIAAAVRNGRQISELAEAGIDIVTCGLAVYEASFEHPFTTHGLGIFREAWDSTATE